MKHLGATIAELKRYKADWAKLMKVPRFAAVAGDPTRPLQETLSFGSNPGSLRMFSYQPSDLKEGAALVVVLHGC